MGRRVGFILFLVLFSIRCLAAGELTAISGRNAAMGYCIAGINGIWSIGGNQAGLGWCRKFSAEISVENRFLVKEMSLKAVGITLPLKRGAFGLSFQHYGFSLYNEMKAGVAFGMQLWKRFSAGIQLDYYRIHVAEGYGNRNLFSCEAGLQFQPDDHVLIGMNIINPVAVKVSGSTKERLASIFQIGISWEFSKDFTAIAEVEKSLTTKPAIKAGMEYRFVKPLAVRIGFLTNPARFTFGLGLGFGKLSFDLASSYQPVLGFSPVGSLTYIFK